MMTEITIRKLMMHVGVGSYDVMANNDYVDRYLAVQLASFCSR